MTPDVSPVIELVNSPSPAPSVVMLSNVVGLALVLQQTPRDVTGDVPALVTLPPTTAVVEVIELITEVVTVAAVGNVEKIRSSPYDVPTILVAYALIWYVTPDINPVSVLVNMPIPEPSVVLLSAVVGLAEVLQQIPRTVTFELPALVILPPAIAVVLDIELGIIVEIVGGEANVVKVNSSP